MKKILLEKKILQKIYKYETKKTFADIFFQMISIAVIGSVLLILGITIINILQEQETPEFILTILGEWEIISYYWLDVLRVFLAELPAELMVYLIGAIIVFAFICYLVLKNSKKMFRRLYSLMRFWKNKN